MYKQLFHLRCGFWRVQTWFNGKTIKRIDFDPSHPASFSGPQKLYKAVKEEGKYFIGMHRIRKFLHNQEAYSLHKPVRRRFQRNHVVSSGKDDLWMADLIDTVKFEKWNKGYKYILLVIDTFSKYVWLKPLKQKTGNDMTEAFKDIFTNSGRMPKRLITDKSQEFRAKSVQDLMKKYNVLYSPTQNETKASTSERAVLTLKSRIMRYLAYKDNYTYLPSLSAISKSYNTTYHRTIGTTPASVKDANQEEVRLATYFAQNPRKGKISAKLKPFKFKIGDYVRITYLSNAFTRAYDQTYSGEVFRVSKSYHRGTLPVYRLNDLQDEEIKGTFYESEMQKVNYDPDQSFKVDRIIKTKGKGQNKQYLVQWKYYLKKFKSWVKANDLQSF
ncbi:uncharacterized protein LOC128554760 [Mercenaria mercenaria]|uniref:uncharacterized protein LOC128554760 n=1 Tax=Mercenaria mercenaria TaxID=6596 RepID=UPI00234F5E3A|nr:uncharacterized protein LOC128554760 [Mercenaria mercenaria]